ncbi:transketolase [Raoultella terrigena]|uniref:Transketolase n=1 Tax=Raoultella terrigena TaxID=577 RepID=A0A485C6M1_RAOTE|nr:transketolase [Raoultella terrigena]
MNVQEVTQLARDIRVATLKSLTNLGFGHYGGSMSVVETLAVLYGAVMKIDPPTRTGRSATTLCCQKDMPVRRSTAP